MCVVDDKQKRTIRPDFDRSISIDFQCAKITSDTDFLIKREIDQRFNILGTAASQIDDPRCTRQTDHTSLQLLRQRASQVAAGFEDCDDADHLTRIIHEECERAPKCDHYESEGQAFRNSIETRSAGIFPDFLVYAVNP